MDFTPFELVTPGDPQALRFVPVHKSAQIKEGLEARVRDPLWFLSRQWQMGEFLANDGGFPVDAEMDITDLPFDSVVIPGDPVFRRIEPGKTLLEAIVEDESMPEKDEELPASGTFSAGWSTKNLEYKFNIHTKSVNLEVGEYYGNALEWYDFEIAELNATDETNKTINALPVSLTYHGMPESRFWAFEDAEIKTSMSFINENAGESELLTILVSELMHSFSDRWFGFSCEQKIGTVRRINKMTVRDNFGITREVFPTQQLLNNHFNLFNPSDTGGAPFDASYFILPNTADRFLAGEAEEEVSFVRDEQANLVWGIEHKYYDTKNGAVVERDDIEFAKYKLMDDSDNSLPKYRLKSFTPEHYIPYLATQYIKGSDQTYLRRARTDPAASLTNPQYKGRVLRESKIVNEEEVPSTAVTVSRYPKMAFIGQEIWDVDEAAEGSPVVMTQRRQSIQWFARKKYYSRHINKVSIFYDYIEEVKGE